MKDWWQEITNLVDEQPKLVATLKAWIQKKGYNPCAALILACEFLYGVEDDKNSWLEIDLTQERMDACIEPYTLSLLSRLVNKPELNT